MRRSFAKYLTQIVDNNKDIVLITADLGYGLFDDFKSSHPNNFINCGSSEQLMIGMAVGMAYQKKIPVCYSITPFLLYRPFEIIRNYVNKEKLNIKLIGSGRDKDYSHDGFSHWSEDDKHIIPVAFTNIKSYWPNMDNIENILKECFESDHPYYINLKR